MRIVPLVPFVLTPLFIGLPDAASAGEELTGRAVMERVDARDDGHSGVSDLGMLLIDKRGKTRQRQIRYSFKDFGEDTYQLMFFLSPPDVKDTGFLTYDYDGADRDDDQWLYLPALKKTKRIAGADKSGSFMGSDFSYADISKRELDNYDYRLMKEDVIDGVPVWQVEAIPTSEEEVDETGYTRSILFVRQDNDVVIRSVNWLKKGKRLKYMEVTKLEQIDGIWVATEIHMTTKKGKQTVHKTVLTSSNVRLNLGLDDDEFTVRRLERGI